mmetsp:Transcript_92052/g.264907  ORF Transcript_92052/g.264907 Transcript_92052/m.264907 type:complete len:311 (-) Transcript_92052:305-1237(-)
MSVTSSQPVAVERTSSVSSRIRLLKISRFIKSARGDGRRRCAALLDIRSVGRSPASSSTSCSGMAQFATPPPSSPPPGGGGGSGAWSATCGPLAGPELTPQVEAPSSMRPGLNGFVWCQAGMLGGMLGATALAAARGAGTAPMGVQVRLKSPKPESAMTLWARSRSSVSMRTTSSPGEASEPLEAARPERRRRGASRDMLEATCCIGASPSGSRRALAMSPGKLAKLFLFASATARASRAAISTTCEAMASRTHDAIKAGSTPFPSSLASTQLLLLLSLWSARLPAAGSARKILAAAGSKPLLGAVWCAA